MSWRADLTLRWRESDAARFDKYVVKTPDCWNWIGYVDPDDGYGRLKTGGKLRRAHRLAYARWVGPLDEDEHRWITDHICRNRRCVNPDHLRLVTYQENSLNADSPIASNARKTGCLRGHAFDEANTYPVPGGGRACRTCRTEWVRAYRARRKADRQRSATA